MSPVIQELALPCPVVLPPCRWLTLLDEGLVEDGSEGGVQLLCHVLEEDGGAKLDRVLQSSEKVRLLKVNHLQFL